MGLREIACAIAGIASLMLVSPCHAYRPFVSTDASVAEPSTVEIEVGYLELAHEQGRNTYVPPHAVLNYGLATGLEVVGELSLEKSRDESETLSEPSVPVKAVLKEGVLQDHAGLSLAVEAGALLPGTTHAEEHAGFEGVGLASAEISPITVHFDFGGGIDRNHHPVVVWGWIGELPISRSLRAVAEVNGDSTRVARANDSGLLGLIYQVHGSPLALDVGLRRGFSHDAPRWGLTTGLTFGFAI